MEEDISQLPGGDVVVPREYEFDASETMTFAELRKVMSFCAIMGIIFGSLGMLSGVLKLDKHAIDGCVAILQGLVITILSVWLRAASKSIGDLVNTEGNDVTHLMSAMRSMKKIYNLQAILYVVAIVGIAILLVFLVL